MEAMDVRYRGQLLTLTKFWGNGKWCLWIKSADQIEMPKMEFVGGYPNEYCIFLEKLTPEERNEIRKVNGETLDIGKITESDLSSG